MTSRPIRNLVLALITMAGVLGLSSIAFAGGGHGFGSPKMFHKLDGMSEQERLEFLENKLDERIGHMTENLELTKAQQTKVRQIFADAQTQLLEIYDKNKNLDDKTMARAEAQAVLKQARQDVGDILTDDQKAKLEKQRAARHQKARAGMVDRLDQKLQLNDTQRTQVAKILDGAHAKMRAVRKASGDNPDAARAQSKAIMKGAADEIAKVLDKKQQAEFARMRERMQERAGTRGARNAPRKRGAF